VSTTLLVIGTRKGLFLARGADKRRTWAIDGPHFAMNAVYACAVDTRRATPRLLVGAHSEHWGPTVAYSDDLGEKWAEAEGGAMRFPVDTGAALERAWQLRPGRPEEPDVVWAGTEPSALWRSEDGGVSYELVRALWDHPHRKDWQPGGGGQALHTVLPDPRDADAVLVAMSTGGVYRTSDGGASWTASNTGVAAPFMPDPHPEFGQCVHKVARDPEQPDRLFLQNHQNDGGVYRSDDGGAAWSSISDGLPASFGFPVVTHPRRGGTAWVFPLVADAHRLPPEDRCRVYRTTDAGASWESVSDGLPAGKWYGAVMRDAMCTDDADPAGVYFGTRDGEVWASPDEGGHWSVVASHLPDVLCVRAATVT
jgi:photosystem II stability/assembly factor-like uncharacterized protein